MLEAAGKATKRITPASSRTANEPSVIINRQALCKLQRDLLRLATQKCAVYDKFEDKWRAAGSEVREKHYFEAMKRVCGFPDMEDQRMCVYLLLMRTGLIAIPTGMLLRFRYANSRQTMDKATLIY